MDHFIYEVLISGDSVCQHIVSCINIRNSVRKVQVHPNRIKNKHNCKQQRKKKRKPSDLRPPDITEITAIDQKGDNWEAHGIDACRSPDLSL